jgi:hypothetical protein
MYGNRRVDWSKLLRRLVGRLIRWLHRRFVLGGGSSLGEGGLLTEIKEHIILSVLVVTGAVLLLGLVWVI